MRLNGCPSALLIACAGRLHQERAAPPRDAATRGMLRLKGPPARTGPAPCKRRARVSTELQEVCNQADKTPSLLHPPAPQDAGVHAPIEAAPCSKNTCKLDQLQADSHTRHFISMKCCPRNAEHTSVLRCLPVILIPRSPRCLREGSAAVAFAERSLQPLVEDEDEERAARADPAVGRSVAQRHLPQPGQAKVCPERQVGTAGPGHKAGLPPRSLRSAGTGTGEA